jgi:hypothetical protein
LIVVRRKPERLATAPAEAARPLLAARRGQLADVVSHGVEVGVDLLGR